MNMFVFLGFGQLGLVRPGVLAKQEERQRRAAQIPAATFHPGSRSQSRRSPHPPSRHQRPRSFTQRRKVFGSGRSYRGQRLAEDVQKSGDPREDCRRGHRRKPEVGPKTFKQQKPEKF